MLKGYEEVVAADTAWNEHSHRWHELLWNAHGASTAVVGTQVWCITPTLGLWRPRGSCTPPPRSRARPTAPTSPRCSGFSSTGLRKPTSRPVPGTSPRPCLAGVGDMLSGLGRSTIWNQTIPDRLRGRLAGI